MSFTELFSQAKDESKPLRLLTAQARGDVIGSIASTKHFDVVVAGGGIHGAVFAKLAALNGLKTLLLEANDYASGTSSRSSKMAHGGLRYLELFDVKQVREGIRAREELYHSAPHLVQPYPFLIPIYKGRKWFKLKLSIGLWFYDLLVKDPAYKHRWIPAEDLQYPSLQHLKQDLLGCFIYYDGIMHDARLVLENIYAARQEGALCLNYARIDTFSQEKDGALTLSWRDMLSGDKHEARAGILVNTTGPWAPGLGRLSSAHSPAKVMLSQGTHLIFDKEWKDPALLFKLEESRYYFVWPHSAGTMVGTTERKVSSTPQDPQPSSDEIAEILSHLEKDIPHAGLSKQNLKYSFAGIRTLPVRRPGNKTSKVSRRHVWSYGQGVLTLLGGKFTTSAWTAFEGLKIVYKLAALSSEPSPAGERHLPGASNFKQEAKAFEDLCVMRNVPPAVIAACTRRLGSAVKFLPELDPALSVIGSEILAAEILYALKLDQAETLEDLLRRRFDLEYQPARALAILPALCDFLSKEREHVNWHEQAEIYRKRLADLQSLMEAA